MRRQFAYHRSMRSLRLGLLAVSLMLAACVTPSAKPPTLQPINQPSNQPTHPPTTQPGQRPTATIPSTAVPVAGQYENPELGVSFKYPPDWTASPGEDPSTLTQLIEPTNGVSVIVFYSPMPPNTSLERAAQEILDATASGVDEVKPLSDGAVTLADGNAAWASEFSAKLKDGTPIIALVTSTARGGRLFTLLAFGSSDGIERERRTLDDIVASFKLEAPKLFGIPREQALFRSGGESDNPRVYDPANGGGTDLVFSGLVTFNPQLEVVPDLAESWDISADGTQYTFHLRPNARFHDGRPVTAQDVIYSWERAADPATQSDTVLTYLGDIVGVSEKRAGQADHISGLKAIDERTLEVTIDAPKPYFLLKLTYSTAAVVDRANVESGPDWYRTPNGTGPYRLIRWDRYKLQVYERNDDFYLDPPSIRYIVVQLFSGVPIRLYETGDIDLSGVSSSDVARVRDPGEPLHGDLVEGTSMCTSYIVLDSAQPPFDDPKVRQAFALAIDKQRYIDVVLAGTALPARGLYPPALPGYNLDLKGLDFNPELARQRLSESKYGGADKLPPIVFTSSGFGSDVDSDVSALIEMWQTYLGVSIQVENLEPDKFFDKLHQGQHGQLVSFGWCADYPDAENFADALFHTGAQQNLGHYSNPKVDALLEKARVERDVNRRIQMYQTAEQILVDDAAAIFLYHDLSFVLVKPYVKGYVLTPIAVPIERYLSIDPSKIAK